MQIITLLAATASLTTSSTAAPTGTSSGKDTAEYRWQVTGWSAGCARSGCYYDFNVTGPEDGNIPCFQAYCSGDDVGYFKQCEILSGSSTSSIPSVAAELDHYNTSTADGIAAMAVSLSFVDADSGARYNYTGHHNATYNQFAAPLESFKIKPDSATAVL
ncbi:hypothetical protein LTR08_004739 [Meristemomyces frigidus]|nr:hypothetical protein LTR08_004739 [Meristemomyces frigidus]